MSGAAKVEAEFPLTVECPFCGAAGGAPCKSGSRARSPHAQRIFAAQVAEKEAAPPEFHLGRVGLVYAVCCTSLTDEEATARINTESPTGISSRWVVERSEPCEDHTTHRHILFSC